MRKLSLFVILVVLSVGTLLWSAPREAQCVYCSPFACYRSCAGECFCMKQSGELSGNCVSLSHADIDALRSQGYSVE